MNKRLKKLRGKLAEKELDAIFISQSANRRYLSGFDGTAGYLIINAKQAILATDFRYTEQAKTEAPDFKIKRITGGGWLPVLADELKIKRLGFEEEDVTYNFYRNILDALKKTKSHAKLFPTEGLVEGIRSVKEPEEIESIAKAAAIADAAFENVERRIKAGMTEKQVAWELEKALRERGSESLPFDIIVGSGPNAALPHAKPTDRVINEGETIVIDMGAKYKGYASDMTRTICAGKPNAKFKKVYNTVFEAQTSAIKAIKKGMTGNQADKVAREVIRKAGYGKSFGHALGHGVGLAEHELPRLGTGSKEKLENGMVFTIEPGIYLTGWGGVRIEDTVLMEGGKVRLLTKARKLVSFQ